MAHALKGLRQLLSVQVQPLGRRHKRRIQTAEGGASSAGKGQVQRIARAPAGVSTASSTQVST